LINRIAVTSKKTKTKNLFQLILKNLASLLELYLKQ
jgi:hypothetical protein